VIGITATQADTMHAVHPRQTKSVYTRITAELDSLKDAEKAGILSRFFKTGKGEYGEGDQFLGVMVPQQRRVARKFSGALLSDIQRLLKSRIHEYRLVSLLILTEKYKKAGSSEKEAYAAFYLGHTAHINNWDLVDLSAPQILGDYLIDRDRDILYRLALSENLWERRIAIMATFAFIRQNRFDDTLRIARMLLADPHALIHKAAGWMLREVGKRNRKAEELFLETHYRDMPRTMLRYAIERFEEGKKRYYLQKKTG